jgi:hypothetical protein
MIQTLYADIGILQCFLASTTHSSTLIYRAFHTLHLNSKKSLSASRNILRRRGRAKPNQTIHKTIGKFLVGISPSKMAGLGDFVVVIATEYTTVYPSAPAPTQFTTLSIPSPSIVQSSTTLGSFSAKCIIASSSGLISSMPMPTSPSIVTHTSSMTGFPPLPSCFERPNPQPQSQGYNNGNNKTPELALTAVILMTVAFLTLLGYAIFQRCRGKCENCAAHKDELCALNSRNSHPGARNFQAPTSTNVEPDLEKGVIADDEREKERTATLAALESNSRFKPLWNRAKGMVASNSKAKEPRTRSNDRFFITDPPVESTSTARPPTAQSLNPAVERPAHAHPSGATERPFPCCSDALEPSLRPPSSIYSRTVDTNVSRNDYAEHYESTDPIIPRAYTTAASHVGGPFLNTPAMI